MERRTFMEAKESKEAERRGMQLSFIIHTKEMEGTIDFPSVPICCGLYSQYNIFGNKFVVTDKYRPPITPIGRGAYGLVCSILNYETGEMVAMKKIAGAFDNLMDAKRTLREIKLLRHLRHENVRSTACLLFELLLNRADDQFVIIFFILFLIEQQIIALRDVIPPPVRSEFFDVYIATEIMDTDLHQIILSNQSLSEEHFQYFLYQILRGLKFIHSANVIHRDLKPSNILLNANCDLKICDFGLARTTRKEESMTEYVVTRWYRAPELLLNSSHYTPAIDIWSVGCMFMELVNRKPLFPGKDHAHQIRLIMEVLGTPSQSDLGFVENVNLVTYLRRFNHPCQPMHELFPNVHASAIDLVQKMLTFDPAKRITVEAALSHPYLAKLHNAEDEPICSEVFSFDFEDQHLREKDIKNLIYSEALHFNPEYASTF